MKLKIFKNMHGVVGLKYTDDQNRLLAGPVFFESLAIDKKLVSELTTDKKDADNMTYSHKAAELSKKSLPAESPKIVCLCGSTRFYKQFNELNFKFTLAGYIVLSIGCDCKSDDGLKLTQAEKRRLDELHFRKIDLAGEVFIINVGGYIGESTRNEIEHAKSLGKDIRYLEATSSWHHKPKERANVQEPE